MYHQYISRAQASLSGLSSDELKELLNDDEKLESSVNQVVGQLENEKDTILSENRSLAEMNLAKEPKLLELRTLIGELSEEGKTLCSSVQEKLSDIKSKSGNMNQDTALAKLEVAALESEEESDKFVKQFLENELPLDSFLEQFMTSRKTMHLRKLKVEKMKEIIRNPRGSSYGGGGSGFFPPNSIGVPYSIGGGVPYPLGPMAMPMPGLPRPY